MGNRLHESVRQTIQAWAKVKEIGESFRLSEGKTQAEKSFWRALPSAPEQL